MPRVSTCIKRKLPFVAMPRVVQDATHRVSTRIKYNNLFDAKNCICPLCSHDGPSLSIINYNSSFITHHS
jgi:hypothetical protein